MHIYLMSTRHCLETALAIPDTGWKQCGFLKIVELRVSIRGQCIVHWHYCFVAKTNTGVGKMTGEKTTYDRM